jgi:hypothetical protein
MVETKLKSACESLRTGKRDHAWPLVAEALAIDPGLVLSTVVPLQMDIEDILQRIKYPLTLTWLAAVCREIGNHHLSTRLLRRYLELAPDAPDREHVARDVALSEGTCAV